MSMLSISGARLPPDLTDICDAFLLPVTLSLPDLTGEPIVYVNPPFEYLTGASLADVVGRNQSMFDGSLTDDQVSQDARNSDNNDCWEDPFKKRHQAQVLRLLNETSPLAPR